MCGIVGGVTNRDITPLLLDGLKRLEYRGYDSSGLVVLSKKNSLNRARSVGKVNNLVENLKTRKNKIKGNIGIAHTRWATHGEPAKHNAHPHISNQVVSVVHNGIIENYLELKDSQIKQGYKFTSDTDTEVIAHLINDYSKHNNFSESIQKAIKDIEGRYAIVVINKEDNSLIAARKGSPLIVGVGKTEGEYFIASDASPFIEFTNNAVYLEDEEMAIVRIGKEIKLRKIKDDSIASHERKQMLSMTRELTDEHRDIVKDYIDESFLRFKQIVKQGRPVFRDGTDDITDKATGTDLATGEMFSAQKAKKYQPLMI